MRTATTILSLLCVLITACGASPAKPAAPASASAPTTAPAAASAPGEPGIAPRPFTAEQIRAAMPVGTDIRFRLEEPGQPAVILHWHVTAADGATMTMSSSILAEDGTLIKDAGAGTSRWDELVEHATFPAEHTTRTDGTSEVPAGKFETIDYVVRETKDGSQSVSTFRFARQLPGPPIEMVIEKDGTVVSRMTLVSRSPIAPR